jgi:hypothetical protein
MRKLTFAPAIFALLAASCGGDGGPVSGPSAPPPADVVVTLTPLQAFNLMPGGAGGGKVFPLENMGTLTASFSWDPTDGILEVTVLEAIGDPRGCETWCYGDEIFRSTPDRSPYTMQVQNRKTGWHFVRVRNGGSVVISRATGELQFVYRR